jgi:hypothetical protein
VYEGVMRYFASSRGKAYGLSGHVCPQGSIECMCVCVCVCMYVCMCEGVM